MPNVGSVITRITAGDDTPAEADAIGTVASDIPKLPKSEGLCLEPVEPIAKRRSRDPADLPSLSWHRLEGLQLCAASLP